MSSVAQTKDERIHARVALIRQLRPRPENMVDKIKALQHQQPRC
jgi:hypothetical protein